MCVCEPGESRNDDLQIDFQQLTLVLLFCREIIAGFGLLFRGRTYDGSLENISNIVEYFALLNLPEPSYDVSDGLNTHQPLPNEIIASRDTAIKAAD